MRKKKIALISFFTTVISILVIFVAVVVIVDPYFHFHAPLDDVFSYELSEERYINDGIITRFDYDALITGTSMTENFKTSEMDNLFETKSIKVPYSGGSFKEIDSAIRLATKRNKNLRYVIRGLDCSMFFFDSDYMRTDLGEYPDYLYNNNPFDDYNYIFSYKALYKSLLAIAKSVLGKKKDVFSLFDDYSNWQSSYQFGKNSVLKEEIDNVSIDVQKQMTIKMQNALRNNILQYFVATPIANPDITFCYFLTPYSVVYYHDLIKSGDFSVQLEAERMIVEELSKIPNVKLYSWNDSFQIVSNLNFYKDSTHYGEWVNSYMLRCMKNEKHLLTLDIFDTYKQTIEDFYFNYDFSTLNSQEDYENDDDVLQLLLQYETDNDN